MELQPRAVVQRQDACLACVGIDLTPLEGGSKNIVVPKPRESPTNSCCANIIPERLCMQQSKIQESHGMCILYLRVQRYKAELAAFERMRARSEEADTWPEMGSSATPEWTETHLPTLPHHL